VTASGPSSSASGVATTGDSSLGATNTSTSDSATNGTGGSSSTVAGASATGAGGSTTSSEFQLSWVDEFDTVDTSRWEPMTHSWDGNLAQFSADTVAANNGILSLNLVEAPVGSDKP
jgi:endo-1,3-1,4-beta-glycanase ExoK